jgi:hypothetical protein
MNDPAARELLACIEDRVRYHFLVADESNALDVDVVELTTYEEALDRGTAIASKLLRQSPYSENPDCWEIRVTDDDGREVLSIPIAAAALCPG